MYRNRQVDKNTSTQLYNNTSKLVQKYTSTQVQRYTSTQENKKTSTRVCKKTIKKVHFFFILDNHEHCKYNHSIIFLVQLNLVDFSFFQLNSSDFSCSYLCYRSCCTSNYSSSVVSASPDNSASTVSSKAVHRPV